MSQERYAFYFNEHHLITDARSQLLLFQRLSDIYFNGEDTAAFPRYTGFVRFEATERVNRLAESDHHWKEHLKARSG